MTGVQMLFWALLLVLQNAAFTWVSRARNSGSLGYHAIAAVFSNGIFFATQFILIAAVAIKDLSAAQAIQAGAVYIASTVTGSVLMHYVSMRWLEKGKRKVAG